MPNASWVSSRNQQRVVREQQQVAQEQQKSAHDRQALVQVQQKAAGGQQNADDGKENISSRTPVEFPLLDTPSPAFGSELAPIRARQRQLVRDRLRRYDEGSGVPRPEDVEHGTEVRVGYERHLRLEAMKVMREAISAGAAESTGGPAPTPRSTIIALMAVHIAKEDRLRRLGHTVQSMMQQESLSGNTELVMAVSWFATTPEYATEIEEIFECLAAVPSFATMHVRQPRPLTQFQHFRAALSMAEAALHERWCPEPNDGQDRSVWVVFGDDDDLWHRRRVAECVRAIRSHPLLEGVGVFATMARANVESAEIHSGNMPTIESEVDKLLRSGHATLKSEDEVGKAWHEQLREAGRDSTILPLPGNHGLEYFDLCPRLRLVHEFFDVTSAHVLGHRLCDLRFREFLLDYPVAGRYFGFEVSFFEPGCWMYFYANPVPNDEEWFEAIECGDQHADGTSQEFGKIGHVSSEVAIQREERELASRTFKEFAAFDRTLTKDRLARYFAFFRNRMEAGLVKGHTMKMDQRDFDGMIFAAAQGSFIGYCERVLALDPETAERAVVLMCHTCRDYSMKMLDDFDVGVLWFDRGEFMCPSFGPTLEQVSEQLQLAVEKLRGQDGGAAVRAAQQAVELARQLHNEQALASAVLTLAEVHLALGEAEPSQQHAEEAVELFQRTDDKEGVEAAVSIFEEASQLAPPQAGRKAATPAAATGGPRSGAAHSATSTAGAENKQAGRGPGVADARGAAGGPAAGERPRLGQGLFSQISQMSAQQRREEEEEGAQRRREQQQQQQQQQRRPPPTAVGTAGRGPAPRTPGGHDSSLRSVLQAVRPDWSSRDLQSVEEKLGAVDIGSAAELQRCLAKEGPHGLNQLLKQAGHKALKVDTLERLRERGGAEGSGIGS